MLDAVLHTLLNKPKDFVSHNHRPLVAHAVPHPVCSHWAPSYLLIIRDGVPHNGWTSTSPPPKAVSLFTAAVTQPP